MKVIVYDKHKNQWFPESCKTRIGLVFKPLIDSNKQVNYGKIYLKDCDRHARSIIRDVFPQCDTGIFYVIKKVENENMFSICFRDLQMVENALSDMRHSIKNYLNGLVWAEYNLNGNNDIVKDATNEVDKIQLEEILNIFLSLK